MSFSLCFSKANTAWVAKSVSSSICRVEPLFFFWKQWSLHCGPTHSLLNLSYSSSVVILRTITNMHLQTSYSKSQTQIDVQNNFLMWLLLFTFCNSARVTFLILFVIQYNKDVCLPNTIHYFQQIIYKVTTFELYICVLWLVGISFTDIYQVIIKHGFVKTTLVFQFAVSLWPTYISKVKGSKNRYVIQHNRF